MGDEFSGAPRTIPFDDRGAGEDCMECEQVIKPGIESRMCHSCRVRPHQPLVRRIAEMIISASSDHPTRTSINLAVRSRLFQELGGGNSRSVGAGSDRDD